MKIALVKQDVSRIYMYVRIGRNWTNYCFHQRDELECSRYFLF